MNYTLIIVSALLQFVLGALWYSPLLFGKVWMQIMEVTNLSKEELQKMQKEMMPFYGLQLVLTLITTFVLASQLAFNNLTGGPAYFYAFFIWLGYIAPTQVACVVWANTKKKYWAKQTAIMLAYQLVGIMISTWILTM